MIRRIALTLAASALSLWGAAPAALADTTYSTCNGVWVVVDYGSLGGVSTQCATSFSTGTTALRSAGFTPTLDNGFLTKINAKPSAPDPKTAYWSYWQATRQSDGSYSGWKYANTGANSSHPVKGNAEGWHYVSVSGGASAPGATPPKNPAEAAQTPTKAPSATKSATTPTTKASSKPGTSTPTATTKPRPSSADPQTSSASPAPSGAATSPPASSPTEAPSADPPGMDVPAGSPIAVIATTSALAVGAAGAGGWWLWKGRRR